MNKSKVLKGTLCAITSEIIFGLSFIFTKKATNVASGFLLMGWRFFTAFILISLLACLGIIKINLKNKKLMPIIILTLLNPIIYFIGETIGIKNTTASESGVALACTPVACLLMSKLLLKHKPTKKQIIGIGVTLIGALITILAIEIDAKFSPLGYLALTLSIITYALYSVTVEKNQEFSGIEITYLMVISGTIVFGLITIMEGIINNNLIEIVRLPFTNIDILTAIIYQGVFCSVLAFFLCNTAIKNIGANGAATFYGISTVVSIISGTILLKEGFTFMQIIGAILIILGVFIANNVKRPSNI